jgi:heme exporter protein A
LNAIEISLLEKRFGSVRALDRVSATIPEGSVTLLSGPNGAGKSTLLRVLASLTRPTRGTVRVLGVDPFSRDGVAHRGRLGYLGQEAALYGELTVQENLEFCANLYGVDPQRIRALIQDMELEPVAGRRVRTLSLGYRRRVGLARARLTDPPLLLLDEPWNGLDAEASQRLTDLLQRHREAGRTALVAAHSPATTAGLFDAVLRLEAGRLAGLER